MRIPRIYLNQPLPASGEVCLGEPESHYLIKVLRMETGRALIAFNGDGAEYEASISSAGKKSAQITVHNKLEINRESPLRSHLAIGISRGDRMDIVLQKATELGVTAITPLFTERTEVKLKGERLEKKMAHWRQILISACEQCQRNVLPELHDACDLTAFLSPSSRQATDTAELKLVLHHRSTQTLKQHATPKSVTLLIGPEGGLSEREIDQALSQGQFTPLTLGPRVLRTETAPIAALTVIQQQWGDFN